MENFITDDFLLKTPTSKRLYHEYAVDLPIIDYHSHLPPKEIAQNRSFENMTDIWLKGDHYKWRAMRTLGIEERFITGEAADNEKFDKWAYTVPYTIRNPLYDWTHLELKRYFGIDKLLNPDSADKIYQTCNDQLTHNDFTPRNLLQRMNVKVVCTTDDPADNLDFHNELKKKKEFGIKIRPTFRPDNSYAFNDPEFYNGYINKLQETAGIEINDLASLLTALENRIDYFDQAGCRLSDHGLHKITFETASDIDLNRFYSKILKGQPLNSRESNALTCKILLHLGRIYHEKGWVQQFHLGALRNANTRMYRKHGPASGFDSIGDYAQSDSLANFLDELDKTDQLPKTILYNLNPSDNAVMATMAGNFNDGSEKGKVQFGTAWWFLDQKKGMEEQMNVLSNMGLLSCFVGMLTDSRSFLSFPRHEYFRRILCNLIGSDVDNGELPNDVDWLGKIVSDVCYYNAKNYFNF